MMQRVLAVALLCAVAATAVIVDTEAELPVMIPRAGDPPKVVRAFTARGGKAAALETSTLFIDGKAAARVSRTVGDLSGSNKELTFVFGSLPRLVRKWVRGFVTGKYKKHDIELVTKTPGTGVDGKPAQFSRFTYKGVLIREVAFPGLGTADGEFKVRFNYQSSDEKTNVQPRAVAESPVRTQFFKLQLKAEEKDKKKKDVDGPTMSSSIYRVDGFSIIRGGGFGKQDPTAINVYFRASSDKSSALPQWTKWFTKRPKSSTAVLAAAPAQPPTKSRDGKLTLFYWTGTTMDPTAGEAAQGQLKPLFTLKLSDVTLKSLDSGEGKAVLSVDTIDMPKNY